MRVNTHSLIHSTNKSPHNAEKKPQQIDYFTSIEDDGVKVGKTVRVTEDLNRLNAMWEDAELGINDDKQMYLGCVGKVMEIEEDDTVQVRWANLDTRWIPIKA
eukprot:66152_1